MARRMFSPRIVCSDAFLDMPISTQALYFHLGMAADDDGFVSPKKIMRILGVQQDDLGVLLSKRFVLPFESGVVVIKHWKINNLIRKDFYQPTLYVEEKNMILTKENGSYTESSQNVNISSTQDRLGKVRLGKDIDTPQSKDKIPFEEFWKLYPNKVEKKRAEEKWNRLPIETQKIILLDLPKRKDGEKWKKDDGRYVEMPTTYINGERWNDEIKVEKVNQIINLN